jgi:hypothetical protein
MKIILRIVIVVALALAVSQAEAQENLKQAGFRFGNTTGFTGCLKSVSRFI